MLIQKEEKINNSNSDLECINCDKKIKIGDRFRISDNGNLFHTKCADRYIRDDPFYPKLGVCGVCNMEIPKSGVCCE